MGRELSTVIQNVLASDAHDVFLAYDITLADEVTIIRGAEVEMTVTSLNLFGTSIAVTPVVYEATLAKNPELKFFEGSSASGGDFEVHDLSHTLGVLVSQIGNVLANASIVVSSCFKKPDGTFEADIYFVGRIRDVDAEDEVTKFTVVADTDDRSAYVAFRSLTQRCLAIYGDDRCGRPAGLIAPGETCSNIYDDAENGCLAKRWQFRFWGVPILRLASTLFGWGGVGDPHGGSHHGCPSVDQFVRILQGKGAVVLVRADQVCRGMIAVDARGRSAVVEHAEIVKNIRRFELRTANGGVLKCSWDHPVIRHLDDTQGLGAEKLAEVINVTASTYVISERRQMTSSVISCVEIESGDCVRITLANTDVSLYCAGDAENEDVVIEGHNAKYPTEIY